MEKKYILQVINRFFNGDFPSDTEQNVQRWLIGGKDSEQKNRVLHDTWNRLEVEPDRSVYQSLDRVKDVLGLEQVIQPAGSFSLRKLLWAVAMLIPVLFGVYFYMDNWSAGRTMVEVTVPNGEQREFLLPDGSKVWLNAGSTLQYTKRFDGDCRSVLLTGEACFSVMKNKKKPFIVKTTHLSVKVIGTEFNVRAYPAENRTTTTLNSGKVQVQLLSNHITQERTYKLEPNQQLVYQNSGEVQVADVMAEEVTDWRNGTLLFDNLLFPEMVQLLERHFGVTVHYSGKITDTNRYYAKFKKESSLKQVLNVLQEIGNFTYRIQGKQVSIETKDTHK